MNELTQHEKYLMCMGFVASQLQSIPNTPSHKAMMEIVQQQVFKKFTNLQVNETIILQEKLHNFKIHEEMSQILDEIDMELKNNK